MYKSISLGLVLAFGLAVVAQADEATQGVKSGLQPGDRIGAFTVTKCAGAVNDEVPEGQELCYRCKLGNRPVVAVFTREMSEELVSLVKELDQLVAKNEAKEMGSFVNILGKDGKALGKEAKELAKKAELQNVAVVVPSDHENGPKNLKLNEEAAVTVLIYKNGVIEKNHAFAKGELCKDSVAKVLADTGVILQ